MMSWRARMRSELIGGVILIGGGCCAIAGLGQYGMSRVNEEVVSMFEYRFLPLDDLGGFKTSLYRARALLVTMLNEKDPAKRRRLHEQIRESSRQVDAAVARGLSSERSGMTEMEKMKSFAAVWGEFKMVRETQLIPAYLDGRQKEAVDLALGAQAKRFDLMTSHLNDLIRSVGAEAAADRDEAKRRASTVTRLLWVIASSCFALLIFVCVQINRLISKSQQA